DRDRSPTPLALLRQPRGPTDNTGSTGSNQARPSTPDGQGICPGTKRRLQPGDQEGRSMNIRWVLGLAALAAAGPATATTYYVSPIGTDQVTASGNSMVSPFRTLQKAASVLKNGDAIVLAAGVYHEGASIANVRNVSIQAAGPAVLDGTNA